MTIDEIVSRNRVIRERGSLRMTRLIESTANGESFGGILDDVIDDLREGSGVRSEEGTPEVASRDTGEPETEAGIGSTVENG